MRAARVLAIVLMLAAMAAGAVYVFRLPLAGIVVRSAMASAGLENPEARVTALSMDEIRLETVAAGPGASPSFSFPKIEADFDWRRLWSDRRVKAVRAGPGTLRLELDEAGRFSIAGFDSPSGGGAKSGGGLPFDQLQLQDIAVEIDGPEGDATGKLNIDYDAGDGGAGSVDLSTDRFLWRGLTFANANLRADIRLSDDGATVFSLNAAGDMQAAGATMREVNVAFEGDGRSWRDVASGAFETATGAARLQLDAPQIELRQGQTNPLMSGDRMEMIFGQDVQRAAIAGAFDVRLDETGLKIFLAQEAGPFRLTTPTGLSLALSPQGSDAPLYSRTGEREATSFRFALDSEGLSAQGGADIEREGDAWRIAAPIELEAFVSEMLSLERSRIEIDAVSDGATVTADIDMRSTLKNAVIGRLTIDNVPFSGGFRVKADLNARRLEVASKSDCFSIERLRGKIAEQDLESSFSDVTLCNASGPLAIVNWMNDPSYALSGDVSARRGDIRLAQTRAAGRPPVVSFDAVYLPARKDTSVAGRVAGGAMTLNEALDFSAAAARFDFALDEREMTIAADIDRLRIDQHRDEGELLMISPVLAAGNAVLTGSEARFRYGLTTLAGRRLGSGEGVHDMGAASGETLFDLGRLQLQPDGLQPDQIFPALKGIIGAAEGRVDGVVRFGWSPGEMTSGADFTFQDIAFGGPTRAVTRTSGFNGALSLTNLFPVTTDGLQRVTVEAVDLDALQLYDGEIAFELPGDNTVRLSRGEFPWFGGSLGVYEASASLSGEAAIPLKAANVDLKQIFEYVDIDGLSGEGVLSGELPLVFVGGKASIENGVMRSEGPGAVRYRGAASQQAAAAGDDAQIAFDILRDLRYNALEVTVNGALDGRLEFQMKFEGTGDVTVRNQNVSNVPVIYRINLDAALLELLRQANLSRDIELQIERGLLSEE